MRIAYVSHVDSRWIKQRPHFISEAMGRRMDRVTFVCSALVRQNLLVSSQRLSVPVLRVPLLPQRFRQRLRAFDPVASAVSAMLIIIIVRPDALVVTHSRHFRLARYLKLFGVRVFYDCMDLNSLFSDATRSDVSDERGLLALTERVFCSSRPIADHVRDLLPGVNVDIVPNALNPESFNLSQDRLPAVESRTVGYIGAISSWFDFEAVLELVESQPDIIVRLWGPRDVEVPAHERLEYMGVAPHSDAIYAMHSCSVLVLPFKLNDLILAVDPVKVYEYVATKRPVVARDYPQLEHFGDFIHRYTSTQEFIDTVMKLIQSPTSSNGKVVKFIDSNSWTSRANIMLDRMR